VHISLEEEQINVIRGESFLVLKEDISKLHNKGVDKILG